MAPENISETFAARIGWERRKKEEIVSNGIFSAKALISNLALPTKYQ